MVGRITSDHKFTSLLHRYYAKTGNRLKFANGMTLNELAFAMWERLEFSQIDPASLSRVLSGQRLFTKRQLEVFCDLLAIEPAERQVLTEALIVALLQRHQFGQGESVQSLVSGFINSIKLHVYFTAALIQQPVYGRFYQQIVSEILAMGHQVTQDSTITSFESVQAKSKAERIAYYNYVLDVLAEVDVVAAEVSFPSTLNIGHEVTLALQSRKPVVAFYKRGQESYFFEGSADDFLLHAPYDEADLSTVIRQNLVYAQLLALTAPRLRESMAGSDVFSDGFGG